MSLFSVASETLMPSSRKKVIVRKLSREWLAGYLPHADFATRGVSRCSTWPAKWSTLPLEEIRSGSAIVRDFNSGELDNPERLLRKSYAGRPRTEGLWLRLRLTDGDPSRASRPTI